MTRREGPKTVRQGSEWVYNKCSPGKDPNRTPRWMNTSDADTLKDGRSMVFSDDWYFVDECWCDLRGPYDTREQAVEACKAYAKTI
ncbi:MAG: hypothetical protein ACXABY_09175 [Candidatus Thorarchaeota archaeon]